MGTYLLLAAAVSLGACLGFMIAGLLAAGKEDKKSDEWRRRYEEERKKLDQIYMVSRVDEHDPDEHS